MVHYLLVKMTSHIASYYANQKDHPSHNDEFKQLCPNWYSGISYAYHLGIFWLDFPINKIKFMIVNVIELWKNLLHDMPKD